MNEDNIKTKKKDKGVWKSVGSAAFAVGTLVISVLLKKKNKNSAEL